MIMAKAEKKSFSRLQKILALGGIAATAAGAAYGAEHREQIKDMARVVMYQVDQGTAAPAAPKLPPYTQAKLADLPQVDKVAEAGEGFDDLISEVNPRADIFSNPQALQAERQYLAAQTPNGILLEGQDVEVPKLPVSGTE